MYNNLKQIRELYGATQDEVAKVAGVTRSTVSLWETGTSKASNAKLEKLSLFYGIGPESFYELESLEEERIKLLLQTAENAKKIATLDDSHNKADDFAEMLEKITFKTAMNRFTLSMKLLLAKSDHGSINDLKLAQQINEKMALRLTAMIEIRENEERQKQEKNDLTLFDLLDSYSEE